MSSSDALDLCNVFLFFKIENNSAAEAEAEKK